MKSYGNSLLLKTATQSFWNVYFGIPDPMDGLVYRRPSTQKTDTYTRLGAAPMPIEWVGNREPKDVNEYDFPVTNKAYEATVRIDKELVKYQQWDEVARLVGNLGQKARDFQTSLSTTLLVAGTSTAGEDDQFFFDTDHTDPGAPYTTSQDNDRTATAATGTQPTDLEAAASIRTCFDALWGFKDDRGDPTVPMDDNPANFIAMVPPVYRSVYRQVQIADSLTGPVGNDLKGTFTTRVNPFMTSAAQFFFFYAGSPHKPVIIQEAGGLRVLPVEEEFGTGDFLYSVEWYGAAAYGQWRTAISFIFT